MDVRPAQLADLFWLRLLYKAAIAEQAAPYPTHQPQDFESFAAVIGARLGNRDPQLICWVAEDGDAIVGFVLAEMRYRGVGAPHHFAVCEWLYVAPAYRDKHVGTELGTTMIQDARERGAESVELIAQPHDMQWIKRGWVPVGVVCALPVNEAYLAATHTQAKPNGHLSSEPQGE